MPCNDFGFWIETFIIIRDVFVQNNKIITIKNDVIIVCQIYQANKIQKYHNSD